MVDDMNKIEEEYARKRHKLWLIAILEATTVIIGLYIASVLTWHILASIGRAVGSVKAYITAGNIAGMLWVVEAYICYKTVDKVRLKLIASLSGAYLAYINMKDAVEHKEDDDAENKDKDKDDKDDKTEEYRRPTERVGKTGYYLGIAEQVLARSTCVRRRYGAVIVNNDEIISTGYNGAPRGEDDCLSRGVCHRDELGVPKGERYELCVAVHAEQNCMLSASRTDMIGGTIYIVGKEVNGDYADPRPCLLCRKMLKNAGIEKVVGRDEDGSILETDVKAL